jgi:hypothetical protein
MQNMHDDNEFVSADAEDALVVRRLPLSTFKSALIQHFSIVYSRNEIVWPTRTGKMLRHISKLMQEMVIM